MEKSADTGATSFEMQSKLASFNEASAAGHAFEASQGGMKSSFMICQT